LDKSDKAKELAELLTEGGYVKKGETFINRFNATKEIQTIFLTCSDLQKYGPVDAGEAEKILEIFIEEKVLIDKSV